MEQEGVTLPVKQIVYRVLNAYLIEISFDPPIDEMPDGDFSCGKIMAPRPAYLTSE
jgi:hypothetical protein